VSIAFPFAFHISVFFHSLFFFWISFEFLLYGRRICTHSVDSSLTHFLGEFPGLGLSHPPRHYWIAIKNKKEEIGDFVIIS